MTQMGPDAIHMQEMILFACASAFAASSPIAEGVRGRLGREPTFCEDDA